MNVYSKELQLNIKNSNDISTLNNFYKTKYEDIKNASNKEEKMNYNNNIYENYNNNNIFGIEDEKIKYNNIKKNVISTTINNKNNINIYNNPQLNIEQNKANFFNKTIKHNNKSNLLNTKNNYLRYYNDHQKDINNLLSDRSKGNKIDEFNKKIIKIDSFADGFNDIYNEFQNNNGSIKSDDDDEPDPRINFEHINQINKCRPLTSYGGLNARRQNLKSALQKNKDRPITSYNFNN